jgi:L-aspartate oxidase
MNLPPPDPTSVRPLLSRTLGVLRECKGLKEAVGTLLPVAESHDAAADPAAVGLMIAVAALQREESRGAHYRTDFPELATVPQRSSLYLDDALAAAQDLGSPSFPLVKRA